MTLYPCTSWNEMHANNTMARSVSHNEGDNKKAFTSYYHPIITIYYHRLFIRNQSVNPQK